MNDVFKKLSDISETQAKILANQDNDRKILEKHSEQLDRHNEILIRNTITVEEHHKRSLLLEAEVKRVDNDVETIKEHVSKVQNMGIGVFKFFKIFTVIAGAGSTLGALFWGIYHLIKKLGL